MRQKKGQAGMMIMLGVGAILLIVIFSVLATFLQPAYNPQNIVNESMTFTQGVGTTAQDDIAVFTALDNGTLVIPTANYSVTLATGVVTLSGSFAENDTYLGTYSYRDDIYVNSTTGRTIIGLLPVILALAIFVFIAGFIALRK